MDENKQITAQEIISEMGFKWEDTESSARRVAEFCAQKINGEELNCNPPQTEGPWRVIISPSGSLSVHKDEVNGVGICRILNGNKTDAKLIAESPDMFDLLIELTAKGENKMMSNSRILEIAEEIIKKITE